MASIDEITVGWSLLGEEFHAAYGQPTRFRLDKDSSADRAGFLSCPAVRATVEDAYQVESPFSLRLRALESHGALTIAPVYPFTTLAEPLVKAMVTVEPRTTWRTPNRCIVQVASPFVFFSDDDVLIEQFESSLSPKSSLNWRLIPGKFNIYAWQRPLNWSFEWDMSLGDFEVRTGETQYSVKFHSANNRSASPSIKLQEMPVSDVLRERLRHSGGVSKMRRGTSALIRSSHEDRSNIRLIGDPQ